MEIEKLLKPGKIAKSCLLVGLLSASALVMTCSDHSAILEMEYATSSKSRQKSITKIVGTGKDGLITDEDLRDKIRSDLVGKGYEYTSISKIPDEELLTFHEKEFGVREGRVYVGDLKVMAYVDK